MGRFVKRTEIMAFLNIDPGKEEQKWALVGNGMTSGSYSYEPQETSETYIVNDNATTTIDSYAVSLDGEMKCIFGDEVYDFINALRYNLATGTDAETEVLLIDKYDVSEETKFKAQLFNCSISISSYGGDGGATPTIGFKINVNGDPKNGTVTIADGKPTFTQAEAISLRAKKVITKVTE